MSSETTSVLDHSSEEVDWGVKGEVKMPAPEKISPAKGGGEIQEPQVLPGPVAASSVEPEEVKEIEPLRAEKANEIEHGSVEPSPLALVSNVGSESAENVPNKKETGDQEAVEKVVEEPEQTSSQDVRGKVENEGESSVKVAKAAEEEAVKELDLPVQSSDNSVGKRAEHSSVEAAAGEKVGAVEALPVKEVEGSEGNEQTGTDDVSKQSSVEEKAEAAAEDKRVDSEPARLVDDAHQSSVLEAKEEKTTEAGPDAVLLHPKSVHSVDHQLTETTKALSSMAEKLEELQEGSVSEVECQPSDIVETALARKLDKPIVEVLEEKEGKVEELPSEIFEKTTDKEVKASEPEEISKPLESVEETVFKPEPETSAEEGKLEKVEELQVKETEVESKPEEILETKLTRKLEEQKTELIDETSDKRAKVDDVSEQPLINVLKEKAEKAEELPPEAEHKPEETLDSKPVEEMRVATTKALDVSDQTPLEEKLGKVEEIGEKPGDSLTGKVDESKLDLVDEKRDEPTAIEDVSEQPLVAVCEDKEEKTKESPAETVKETMDKEPNVSEVEHKTEVISDPKPVESVQTETRNLVVVPEHALIEEALKEVEAVEPVQVPAKTMEETQKEVQFIDEISEAEPTEKPVEQIVDVPEKSRSEESENKVEKEEESKGEISGPDRNEKLDESKDELVERKADAPIEKLDGEMTAKEVKFTDVSETEPPEKFEEPKAGLVIEQKPEDVIKPVDLPVEKEELCVQEAQETREKENEVSEAKILSRETAELAPSEKLDESKPELVEEKSDDPVEKVEIETGKEKEKIVSEAECVQEMLESAAKQDEAKVQPVEEKVYELEKTVDEPKQSHIEEKVETVEVLPVKEVVLTEEEEVKFPNPERKLQEITEPEPAKSVVERKVEAELENVEELVDKEPKQSPVEGKIETGEVFPVKEVAALTEEEEVKVSDPERKLQEITEPEPVKSVVERQVETEQENVEELVDNAPKRSPVEEKVETGEVLPVKEVVLTEEEEVKVSNPECKLEGIAESEPAKPVVEREIEPEKFVDVEERSLVDWNEAKLEKVEESVDKVPKQSAVEEKVETGEVLPVKEVVLTGEEELNASDPKCTLQAITEPEPAKSVVEGRVGAELENVEELVDKAPKQSPVEEKVETGEVLPVKEMVLTEEEEVKVLNPECKLEEIAEPEPAKLVVQREVEPEKFVGVEERSLVDSNEAKLGKVEESVDKAPKQSPVEEKVETGLVLPVKEVLLTEEGEAKVSNPECKLEEIAEPEPAKPVVERAVEPEKFVDVEERSLVDSNEAKSEKVEELVDKAPKQSPVEGRVETGEVLPVKEVLLTEEGEVKVLDSERELQEVTEPEPAKSVVERQVGAELENVEELVDKAPKQSPVEEKVETGEVLPVNEVALTEGEEVKVSNPECKLKEITEPEPAKLVVEREIEPEKFVGVEERSLVDSNEAKLDKVEESVDKTPKQSPVEEKVETGEVLPVTEVVLTEGGVVKDSDPDCKLQEIAEPESAKPVFERQVEPDKFVGVEERSLVESNARKLENVEKSVDKAPKNVFVEEKVGTGEVLPVKEVALTEEEEGKASDPECKLHEITEPGPAKSIVERQVEPEKFLDVEERSLAQSNAAKLENVEKSVDKEPEATFEKEVKVLEPECKLGEISESASSVEQKPVEQPEVIEESTKELPEAELVKNVEKETLKDEVEIPEKIDAAKEEKEPSEKTLEIDTRSEEKVSEPVKTGSETEAHQEKTEEKPCVEVTEKPVEVSSKGVEPVAENICTKDETVEETTAEGNGDEEEAEKSEGAKKKEHGRSLKDKLEKEKHDYEASKTDTHNTESTDEHEDAHTEEVAGKSAHKHSNNIMKMVKSSLSKAKKAITGKSGHPKAPVSEVKEDEACK